jgi:exo-beta-1,3-glucanase (GH17 family)
MSGPYHRSKALLGAELANLSLADLKTLVRRTLADRVHGLCFSPYLEGQAPGTHLTERQIRARLEIIQAHTHWIRSFSCQDGHELIPRVAAEMGLKTMVGAWLDDDLERNELELSKAIEIAKSGHADILAIGNEVLLREDLDEETLIDYIQRAKSAAPGVPVAYVDAYFKFVDHPRVTEACDLILANCYPFWEGCPADYALPYMKEMYAQACKAAKGKKVIVSETGWPNLGAATQGAVPSPDNALRYFLGTFQWAEEAGVEIFYFAAFDEAWKVDKEGDVGAFWGLWDKHGHAKFD